MGAYGTPEHPPGENQKPQYQFGNSQSSKRGIMHGDLKTWQKVLLTIYCCVVGLLGLVMLVSIGDYSGNKVFGTISAITFITLALLFAVKINTHKKGWPFVVCSTIVFFAYFDGMSGSQPSQATVVTTPKPVSSSLPAKANSSSKANSKASTTTSSKAKATPSKTVVDTVTQYKGQCTAYKYKEIARNPNNYKGKLAKFTGQVVQVENSWGSNVLRVNVTKSEYGMWDDTIYVEYTPKSDNESRILDNDIITVYGKLDGIKTYTTILGSDVSIPYLQAQYIDILPESNK